MIGSGTDEPTPGLVAADSSATDNVTPCASTHPPADDGAPRGAPTTFFTSAVANIAVTANRTPAAAVAFRRTFRHGGLGGPTGGR